MSWFSIKFIRLRYWLRSAFNKQYKPTIEEFLTLPVHWQFDWISKNIDDYDMRLYGDGYLGISYPVDTDILDQYRENPLDYGVSIYFPRKSKIFQRHGGKKLIRVQT